MEAGDLIRFIDTERQLQRLSQIAMAERAGSRDVGQQYYRMWAAGDGRLSTVLKFVHALGYDIQIVKQGAEQ